jgi:thiamine biosynthesis protein ThiS
MRIILNGDPAEVPESLSVAELLHHLKVDGRLVAVELNRVVVKRSLHDTTQVHANDEVEIVAFVGGGRP